jgi:ABC-type phosphate transport system substrate-binding protein
MPARIEDPAKRAAIKDFLIWMMAAGQQYCEPLAYAKLPKEVVAKETKALALIQ